MNKLLLNNSARNHIRIFPMPNAVSDIPDTEQEKILWCAREFERLQNSEEAERLATYKNRSKGYLVSVWGLKGRYYLIMCIRNEFGTFNDTIYISEDKQDLLSIAKFLNQNIETIMEDYRQQILDAKTELFKEQLKRDAEKRDAEKRNAVPDHDA